MGEDYFGTPAQPPSGGPLPAGPPPGWAPPGGTGPVAPQRTVTLPQTGLAAIGVAVSGLLACLGAWGPWLHATGGRASFDYGGLHSDLDGKWVLAIGVIALVLGVALYSVPSGNELRTVTAVAVTVLGVVGLVIVGHQYVKLSDALSEANGPLGALLGVHVSSGWGIWIAGLGCMGIGVTGFFSLVL